MTDKLIILQEAIGTGEVAKIKYNGGSQPGAIREIVPKEIVKDKLRAYCLASDMDLTFTISKIEIASEGDVITFNGLSEVESQLTNELKDFQKSNKEEWERNGWQIVADDFSVGLHSGSKRRVWDICISFEGNKKKPWIVACYGETAIPYKNSDEAIKKFLEYYNSHTLQSFIEKAKQENLGCINLKELFGDYKEEWERRGWIVVYDKNLEFLGLFSEKKDGAEPDIFIAFDESEVKQSGPLKIYKDDEEEMLPREKPWAVRCGEKTVYFKNLDAAIKRFLEHCNNHTPQSFIEKKKQTKLDVVATKTNFYSESNNEYVNIYSEEQPKAFRIGFVLFIVMLVVAVISIAAEAFSFVFVALSYIVLYLLFKYFKN